MIDFSGKIEDEQQLEELISTPTAETVKLFEELEGDIMILGIAGKIGPSLGLMAKRACELAGVNKRIIGVSRFRSPDEKERIEQLGIETLQGDLLDRDFLESLPKIKNIFFLAGIKFGSEDNRALTWAMNTYLPALVVEYFKESRIVAYSTGCVYPLVSTASGGSTESDLPLPVGEYAQSCLGRERMFEYGSQKNNTPLSIIRLNYAVEPRYGVLVDIANKVKNEVPIDLSMGYFNAIWQGDSNTMVLQSLAQAAVPAFVVNVTGEEILSVKEVARRFGELFKVETTLIGKESKTALLSNSKKAFDLFGKPNTPISKVIKWVAHWLEDEKRTLGKPTHFEVRDGKY